MSNPGGVVDPASDLQGLFASLRSSGERTYAMSKDGSPAPTANRQSYSLNSTHHPTSDQLQPTAMSPGSISSLNVSQPRGVPSNLSTSRSATPGDRSNADRTANLLNLLKFSTPAASPQTLSQQPPPVTAGSTQENSTGSSITHSVHGRGISASDLVASYMGKLSTPTPRDNTATPPATNHQDYLLKLLNRTAAAQSPTSEQGPSIQGPRGGQATILDSTQDVTDKSIKEQPSATASEKRSATSTRNESPIRVFGSNDDREPTPFEPQDLPKPQLAPKKDSIFTYVNPFEQLAASSPRHAKPRSLNGDGNKRKTIEPTPISVQTSSRRKLTPSSSEVLQSIESPAPTPLRDGRSQVEALMGMGAPSQSAGTVAQALNEVGSQLDEEVETALANAEEKESELKIKKENAEEATMHALEDKTEEFATEVKLELEEDANKSIPEDNLTTPVAEVVKDAIDAAAEGIIANDWESAEGEGPVPKAKLDRAVPVYQFPMKPFVSIDIQQRELPTLTLQDGSVTNIARLKKEFDQIDRTLATATSDFIVYGSPRSGGLRVIRQDDGNAKHIFAETHDRIFNVSVSTAPITSRSHGFQNVIATGVSGTVYWATVFKPEEEQFADDMEENGLIFKPWPAHSDNSSGGQLKTRAKKSSRSPDFFAIGRGKSIQIVFPAHARRSKSINDGSIVDTEKYFKDRVLKISTGKAGKDFTFSEDDTTILTLDKTGRLRFWDIRDLVDEDNAFPSALPPIDIKFPILTFVTTRTNEKSWPTSVLLVDKPRPYTKGVALRYVVVGMKQNHTLQLWDLCLGKAVQEVNFPHEKESDAICSVSYHPTSGIVVVGHPTRNSIYLIHLSAPKYNLPPISQAKFVQRLANKDTSLPKPEATAILSGIREYTFSNIGQLRSVELVSFPTDPMKLTDGTEDPVLFELYVMHSKGVACVAIKREDLGWSKESKVYIPIDAEKEGLIVVKDMREPQLGYLSDPSSNNGDGNPAATTSTGAAQNTRSKVAARASPMPTARRDAQTQESSTAAAVVTSKINPEKLEKKKKKRQGAVADNQSYENENTAGPSQKPINSNSNANLAQQEPLEAPSFVSSPTKEASRPGNYTTTSRDAPELTGSLADDHPDRPNGNGEPVQLSITGDLLDKELKKIEIGVSGEFNKALSRELGSLYQRFAEDKRIQDAAGAAKQDAILRLVSSTLGDNVDKALSRIVMTSIQQVVVPSIADITSSVLDKRVSEILSQQLQHIIPPVLKLALPEAISRGVQNPDVLRMIAEQLSGKVAGHVEKELNAALHNTIIPAFQNLAVSVAQNSGADTENRVHEHLRRAEIQRRDDAAKVDQLTALVRGLSETVHMMAAAQSDFQQEILKLQQQAAQDRQGGPNNAASSQGHDQQGPIESSLPPRSPEQEELEMITNLMIEGRFEESTIQVSCVALADPVTRTNASSSGFNQTSKPLFMTAS